MKVQSTFNTLPKCQKRISYICKIAVSIDQRTTSLIFTIYRGILQYPGILHTWCWGTKISSSKSILFESENKYSTLSHFPSQHRSLDQTVVTQKKVT